MSVDAPSPAGAHYAPSSSAEAASLSRSAEAMQDSKAVVGFAAGGEEELSVRPKLTRGGHKSMKDARKSAIDLLATKGGHRDRKSGAWAIPGTPPGTKLGTSEPAAAAAGWDVRTLLPPLLLTPRAWSVRWSRSRRRRACKDGAHPRIALRPQLRPRGRQVAEARGLPSLPRQRRQPPGPVLPTLGAHRECDADSNPSPHLPAGKLAYSHA